LATIAMVAIRAPHGQRSRSLKVVKSKRGTLESLLLTVAWISFFFPLIWMITPAFSFAEYPIHTIMIGVGFILLALGLWLFYRSHADLGTNWSITLEVREKHQLITEGVYRQVRHPMYTAILLYSLGQMLVIPNWVAGPAYLVAMGLLIALRLGPE